MICFDFSLAVRLDGVGGGHGAGLAQQGEAAAAIEVPARDLQAKIDRGVPVGPQLVDRPGVAVADRLDVVLRDPPGQRHAMAYSSLDRAANAATDRTRCVLVTEFVARPGVEAEEQPGAARHHRE